MRGKIALTFSLLILKLCSGANLDSPFALDPEELQLKEIADNVRRMSGAVMGLSDYIFEIRSELRSIRSEIVESRSGEGNGTGQVKPKRDPEELRRQSLELADKVERLLAMEQSPEVDLAKEELRKTVEKNFLRMLAAILVTGPAQTQERSEDIFKLMRAVLNGEIDFNPVVQRLPLILRDSETSQFVNLLLTLRESERGSSGGSFRQGLLIDSTGQIVNYPRPVYNNVPTNQQYYNPVQNNVPQYIPGNGQYPSNINNFPVNNVNNNNNNFVPNNVNNYNPNFNNNNNNLQQGAPAQNLNNNNNNSNNNNNNGNSNTQTATPTQAPNQLPSINSIIDGINQTNQLLKEIPTLVEGLQTLVESLEGIFG